MYCIQRRSSLQSKTNQLTFKDYLLTVKDDLAYIHRLPGFQSIRSKMNQLTIKDYLACVQSKTTQLTIKVTQLTIKGDLTYIYRRPCFKLYAIVPSLPHVQKYKGMQIQDFMLDFSGNSQRISFYISPTFQDMLNQHFEILNQAKASVEYKLLFHWRVTPDF